MEDSTRLNTRVLQVQVEGAGGRRAERGDGVGLRVALEVIGQDRRILVDVIVGGDLVNRDTRLLHHVGVAGAAVFEGRVTDFLDRANRAGDLRASSLRSLEGSA